MISAKTEENNRMGKTRDLFKKIRGTKGTFHAKMGSIKDRNGMDLMEVEDFFFPFIFISWRLITLQYCGGFAIHCHESAMDLHCSPPRSPLPKQKILRKGGKNTQKNYTKKIFMTQIITMV